MWFTEQGYIDINLPTYPRFSNLGQVVIPAGPAPDVSIVGTVPQSVPSESPLTFTLTVTNNGLGTASGVRVTDKVPANTYYVSATGGMPSYDESNNEISFALGSLAPGARTSVSFMVRAQVSGTITDEAQVAMDQADPTPKDNQVTLTTNVFSTTADLALSGTAPGYVVYGQGFVTYSLTVKNNGQTEATNVMLRDIPPMVGFFSSATGGVTPDSHGYLNFALGNLAPGANTSVEIVWKPRKYTSTKDGDHLTDQASVTMDQTDPTPDDDFIFLYTLAFSYLGTGCGGQNTAFVLTFAEPVDPAWAENVNNYQLVDLHGSPHTVLLRAPKYNAATNTVTLKALHQQNMHRLYRLTVIGAGERGENGAATGPENARSVPGDPGGNIVILVGIQDLANKGKSPASLRNYKLILHAQHLEMKRLGLV
jgi:uncharacterized repeat protein (TIGR01451 family)